MASRGAEGGGCDKNFVETPPDELICLICQSVALDPQQLTCCGKLYCKTCLDKQKKAANSCPTCRKVINSFPDYLSSRRINALMVKCDNERKGCKWQSELSNLKGHMINCKFNMTTCKLCSQKVPHQDIVNHLKSQCRFRRYQCPLCKMQGEYATITTTHLNECPNVTIWCSNPGCYVKEQRSKMSGHRSVCPKEKVPCTYSTIGCEVTITREGLQEHMAKSVEQHLTIAMNRIVVLQEVARLPPLVFKMTNFKKLKRDNEDWHSPCFYTHTGGYKMCLGVCANGTTDTNGDGEGAHVSVFVYIMSSKNNKNLLWPFRGEITIELLNQLDDKNHEVCTLNYDTKRMDGHNCIVDAVISDGWGTSNFISHGALSHNPANNCQYLKDDCLHFRVTQVKVYKSNKPWLTPCS